MYCCFLHESGSPEKTARTTHFVLLGLAIPAHSWKAREAALAAVKAKFGLAAADELDAACLARRYPEQEQIPDFALLAPHLRREAVAAIRRNSLQRLWEQGSAEAVRLRRKLYARTAPYLHLTRDERLALLDAVADMIARWGDARVFGAAIDKRRYTRPNGPYDFALEQLVTKFNTFLSFKAEFAEQNPMPRPDSPKMGLLICDREPNAAERLTECIHRWQTQGTLGRGSERVMETPVFAEASSTHLMQAAALCSYAVRRYYENGEERLFDRIAERIDRRGSQLAGIMHYTGATECPCRICASRAPRTTSPFPGTPPPREVAPV